MKFAFFTQQSVSLLLPFVYQVDPYFVNSIDMCNTNEIKKTSIYIQIQHKKILFFLWKDLVIFLVFTEQITFKHFIFIKITKSKVFLFFSDHINSENWKFFKDYDVYLINVFRMSHALKGNLTKLVPVRKGNNPKFKICISAYL